MNDIYTIDTTKPHVSNLPKDNILRVIWAYGAVLKYTVNKSNLPSIEIEMREILPNGNLSSKQTFTKIPITEINLIRLMTIWKGNRKTTSFWEKFDNYDKIKSFSINTNEATCIPFKDIETFKYKYDLGYIENKKFLYHFSHSTFTKLKTNKNITVFVPSIELLSSTFSPRESTIKGKLFQENINTILNCYIKEAKIINNKYHIILKEKKFLENAIFLAYATLNKETRQRLQLLRNSLEIQSDYPDRYPIILPYHPTKMEIAGDGFWLNKTTFLLFRINGYSLPNDNKIRFYNFEIKSNQQKTINKKYIRFPAEIDKEDIPIDDYENPSTRNASKHITSEIYILNENLKNIEFKSIKSETPYSEFNIDTENKKDIDAISSASPNQKEESNHVGKLKFYTLGKDHLNQKEVLYEMIKSLEHHICKKTIIIPDYNIYLEDIMFFDRDCNFYKEYKNTTFRMLFKKEQKYIPPWTIRHRIKNNNNLFSYAYRKYLLVKLILSNGKQAYLLEIERKKNEGFLGMIFNTLHPLEYNIMINILKQVVEKKGVVKNIKIHGIKKIVFRHVEKDGKLHHCIKKALQKGILQGAFM